MSSSHTFRARSVVIAAFALLIIGTAWALAPSMVNYQGYLTDSGGAPLDTTVDITFRIYDDYWGGTPLWDEIHTTTVTNGSFEVMLGQADPLSSAIFDDNTKFLGIKVGDDAEMTPLTQFVTVPYAYRVESVDDALGGTIYGKLNVGNTNTNSGQFAMVAGLDNHANGDYSVICGGGGPLPTDSNSAGYKSFIGGGASNIAGDGICVVAGGYHNEANNVYATVGGGADNIASGEYGPTVAGGMQNEATGQSATVSGGHYNYARGNFSVVAGGGGGESYADSNSAAGDWSVIDGGRANTATGLYSVINGGYFNRATNSYSIVGGGFGNYSSNPGTVIAGGNSNAASEPYATISGGQNNKARGSYAVIGGGGGATLADSNAANAQYATVTGGNRNRATGLASFLGGGRNNRASGEYSVVCGGGGEIADSGNVCTAMNSFIGGGVGNRIDSSYALYDVVAGGYNNTAASAAATVPGGADNHAYASFSFAAGHHACANNAGAFVWADNSTSSTLFSSAQNQFNVRAAGGIRLFTNSSLTSGMTMAAGGSGWVAVSDSTKKQNIRLVDTETVLDRIAQLPIKQWSYKSQDPSIEHIGPMAQDFWNAFHLGEDSLGINQIDPDGIALAAIQELVKQNQALEARVAQLEQKLSARSEKETQTALNTINKR